MREFYYFIFNFWKSVGNGCDSSNHSLTQFTICLLLGLMVMIIGAVIEEIVIRGGGNKNG